MDLTLVRHTRPAVTGVCYGRSEVALAASFDVESEALLAELGPVGHIVSSPASRCLRLAERLGARLAVPVAVDPDLREMDFGVWEGRRWDALPRAEIDAWAADLLEARPHGGESVAMLCTRTRHALARAATGEDPCVVVTHAGVIRAALLDAGVIGAWSREIPFARAIRLIP